MKNIFSLLVLVATLSASLAQNHDSKPIRFIFESIHDHLGNLDINSKRVQLFSPDHRLLYEADLYEGKELDEQFFYYNKDGKMIRDHRIFHQVHESGDYRFIYDEKGNLIEERNVNDIDEILERKVMTYNNKGQMTSQKVEFLHHQENKMIPESYFEFTYDENGKIATKAGWEDEKEDETVTYKYIHTENSEAIKKYDKSGQLQESWVQKWDEKGRLIEDEHTKYSDGRAMTKTITFTYDKYDHILTETLTKTGSSIKKQIIFEYEYDEHGNWIERKESKKMGVKETQGVHLKRHIEYYEHDEYEHPPMELDETFVWKEKDGERIKEFQESHVRINNNEGELEWVVRRNGPTLYQVDEYEYLKNGNLDRINHLNNENKENAYTISKYNDQDQMIEQISYSFKGEVDEKTTYEYDKQGRLIKEKEEIKSPTNGQLETVFIEEYKYDDLGNIEKVELTEYGSEYIVDYEYDEKGNLAKETQTPQAKDEDVMIKVYSYENGQLSSLAEYEGTSKKTYDKIIFEYDNQGELTRSAQYKHGELDREVDYVYFE
ncbi:MAG: hypothetical protein WDZ35_04515 [Crocinitomicaceae bacterium]